MLSSKPLNYQKTEKKNSNANKAKTSSTNSTTLVVVQLPPKPDQTTTYGSLDHGKRLLVREQTKEKGMKTSRLCSAQRKVQQIDDVWVNKGSYKHCMHCISLENVVITSRDDGHSFIFVRIHVVNFIIKTIRSTYIL